VEILTLTNSRDLARRMAAKLALANRLALTYHSKSEWVKLPEQSSPMVIVWDIEENPIQLQHSIEQIRMRFNKQPIQIIGLLDRGAIRLLDRYLEAGLNDWISKPLIPGELNLKLGNAAEFLGMKTQLANEKSKQQSEEEYRHRWISSIAHDLRNPLVSIRGLSQFVKEGQAMGQSPESQNELLDSIAEASNNLLSMVDEMSHFSSFEDQEIAPQLKPVDIYELVHNTFVLYKACATKKDMRLLFLNEDFPPLLLADPVQISRVITNGISNAIKYGKVNSTVSITLRNHQNQVILEIENEGKTIPPEDFELLFKPFGKTSVRPTNGEQSTGLGLAICKKIVEAHCGHIELRNIDEKGVCFHLSLPAAPEC